MPTGFRQVLGTSDATGMRQLRECPPSDGPPRFALRRVRSFVVAADRVLTGLPNPLEIARVRTAVTYRVVDAITEAVRQADVVHVSLPPTLLESGECSTVGIQSLNSGVTGSK